MFGSNIRVGFPNVIDECLWRFGVCTDASTITRIAKNVRRKRTFRPEKITLMCVCGGKARIYGRQREVPRPLERVTRMNFSSAARSPIDASTFRNRCVDDTRVIPDGNSNGPFRAPSTTPLTVLIAAGLRFICPNSRAFGTNVLLPRYNSAFIIRRTCSSPRRGGGGHVLFSYLRKSCPGGDRAPVEKSSRVCPGHVWAAQTRRFVNALGFVQMLRRGGGRATMVRGRPNE